MYQIIIGVYIGSEEAAFSGIFCSTLIYRNKCLDFRGSLQLHVRSTKEEDESKGRKGMFNEPEFNDDSEPLLRTNYSAETGKVIIYVNFSSVQHYIGGHCQYKKTLPAQVFLADLVAERCFYEIAKKKVDTSGALIRPEGRLDAIQSVANNLSQKNGKKVHEALVDQKLIEEAKSII